MAVSVSSGNYIEAPSLSVRSLFFFMNSTQTDVNTGMFSRHNSTLSTDGVTIILNNVAGKILCYTKAAVTDSVLGSVATVNNGAWRGIGFNIYYDTVNASQIYVDGAFDNSKVASMTVTEGANPVRIGRTGDTFWQPYIGQLAEIAIWSDQRTPDEHAALAKGFPARLISPQTLNLYIPAVRDILDVRGNALTVSGTSVSDHPRVY